MKLWRYYFSGMGQGIAVASGVLIAIFFLFDLISEAESVGSGSYSFFDAAAVVLMKMPARFVELSPIIAMLGVTYALGVLARNVELVAIRTTGISSARLAFAAVVAVLLFYLVVAAVELVGRPLHQVALSFRMLQVAEQGQPVRGDLWIADPAGMVRITDWDIGLKPKNVELFVFGDGNQLERYLRAERVEVDETGVWHFLDAQVTDFRAAAVKPQTVAETSWQPQVYSNLALFDLPLEGMTLLQLRSEMLRRQSSGEDDTAARLAWYIRWLLPLSGMAFAAFAAAIGLRDGERGGLGGRLAVGVLAALILYLGQQIVLNAALVAGLGPGVAALLPVIGVWLLAFLLLRRAT